MGESEGIKKLKKRGSRGAIFGPRPNQEHDHQYHGLRFILSSKDDNLYKGYSISNLPLELIMVQISHPNDH